MMIDISPDSWYTDFVPHQKKEAICVKSNSALSGGAAPQDTLAVYLALEKRVKALEDELAFTKLIINSLYKEIKELKKNHDSGA